MLARGELGLLADAADGKECKGWVGWWVPLGRWAGWGRQGGKSQKIL